MVNPAITLAAEPRTATGKGPARTLRRAGRIPGVIYGLNAAPVMVSLEQKAIALLANRAGFMSQIFDLRIGSDTVRVLPKAVQLHPVTDAPEHADFLRVTDNTEVHVLVRVRFTNSDKSPGLRRGGTLNAVRRELELVCKAARIPSVIEIDLNGLQIGDSIHISHVKLPEGTRPAITDRDFTIATIVGRKAEKEAAEGAEGEAGATGDAAKPDAAKAGAPAKAGAAKPAEKKAPAK